MFIGCHLSSAKGLLAMGEAAHSIGADTFQFFTRNPRGGKAKAVDPKDSAALRRFLSENCFGPVIAHAPYTMNPCAAEEKTLEFARQTMADDLQRMEQLPGNFYNLHPGCHVGQGTEAGIVKIAALLNETMQRGQTTFVLLETMAGKGSEIGSRFEELREIVDRAAVPEQLGICLDTCHVYDAGYDIRAHLDEVLAEFDRVIGLKRLKALHINDTMYPMASHHDRHQRIGEGMLGSAALWRVVHHPALEGLPMILETPNELPGYAEEIAVLRKLTEMD